MRDGEPNKSEAQNPNIRAYIQVVGMNRLQNNLLLSFLKEGTAFDGTCLDKLEHAAPVRGKDTEMPRLLLLDWTGVDGENLWEDIRSWRGSNSHECFFLIYNVDPKMEIERSALANNIQGLFYKNDPLHIIPKGIHAILNGDIWYSRKTLSACILRDNSPNNRADSSTAGILTLREKEILILMASGCTNKQIAGKLHISSHTVKTHIYNIYKKINVDGRFQAALWAAKFL